MTTEELLDLLRDTGGAAKDTGAAIGNALTPDLIKDTPDKQEKAGGFFSKAAAVTAAPTLLGPAATALSLAPAYLNRKEGEAAALEGQAKGAGAGVGVNADPDPDVTLHATETRTPAPAGRGGRVSESAPAPAPPAFESIASKLPPAPGQAPAPSGVEQAVAAAPTKHKLSAEDEYAAAQAESDARRHSPLAAILNFGSGFASNGEELRKGIGERINAPVQELLAKRKYLDEREAKSREDEKYAKEKALDALEGPQYQQSQLIYKSLGIDPKLAAGLPASSLPRIIEAKKVSDAAMHEAALIESGNKDRTSRETVASKNNATQIQVERMKAKAALDAAGLAHSGTSKFIPLPPESVKIENQLEAARAAARLGKAHKSTNGILSTAAGILPGKTDWNAYNDDLDASVSTLAGGFLPQGRETPQAVELIHKMFPDSFTGGERAQEKFRNIIQGPLSNAREQIRILEASGKYDPAQLATLKQQLATTEAEASDYSGAPAGGGPAPTGVTRTVNGVTKRWDGTKWVG